MQTVNLLTCICTFMAVKVFCNLDEMLIKFTKPKNDVEKILIKICRSQHWLLPMRSSLLLDILLSCKGHCLNSLLPRLDWAETTSFVFEPFLIIYLEIIFIFVASSIYKEIVGTFDMLKMPFFQINIISYQKHILPPVTCHSSYA